MSIKYLPAPGTWDKPEGPVPPLPRIAGLSQDDGLFVESLVAAMAQGDPAAKSRMRDFLAGKAAKVAKPR